MIYDWQYEEAKELGIKPCQCGGAAVIKEIGNAHTKSHCVQMECSKCHMKRKQCVLNGRGILTFEELKRRVIEKWNTRPVEDEMLVIAKLLYKEIEEGRIREKIINDPLVENGLTHPKNLLRRVISKLEASPDVPKSEDLK